MAREIRPRADQPHGRGENLGGAVRSRRGARGLPDATRSKKAAGLPKPGAVDTLPFGFDAVKPALDLMSSYALEMKIIPRRYTVEELFDDTTRAL